MRLPGLHPNSYSNVSFGLHMEDLIRSRRKGNSPWTYVMLICKATRHKLRAGSQSILVTGDHTAEANRVTADASLFCLDDNSIHPAASLQWPSLSFLILFLFLDAHRFSSFTLCYRQKTPSSHRHALPETISTCDARDRDDRRWRQDVHMASRATAAPPCPSEADQDDCLFHGFDRDPASGGC